MRWLLAESTAKRTTKAAEEDVIDSQSTSADEEWELPYLTYLHRWVSACTSSTLLFVLADLLLISDNERVWLTTVEQTHSVEDSRWQQASIMGELSTQAEKRQVPDSPFLYYGLN